MFGRSFLSGLACILLVSVVAGAAELQVNSCDTLPTSKSANSTVSSIAGMEGAAALRLTMPSTSVDTTPYVWYYVGDSTQWKNYDGVRFWVRSTSGTDWGVMEIIYSASYYRFFAGFTITDTWTEVTIPWREFCQKNYKGTIDSVIALPNPNMQVVGFVVQPSKTKDAADRPAVAYDVDDIRLVDGLALSPTPTPSAPALPISAARAASRQPLKIVVYGDSITYGNQLPDRTTQAYTALLQTMLRNALGYDEITVVNFGIGGKEYWAFACNVQDFIAREAPHLIITEFMTNDVNSASGNNPADTSNIGNYRDNINRALDIFLRYNQADVAVIVPPPNVTGGKNNILDPWAAQIEAAIAERNLVKLDVYGHFMALSEAELLPLYVADTVHLSVAGHQEMAEAVYNDLLPHLQNADGEAPDIAVVGAVLSGTVTDDLSALVELSVGGIQLGWLSGVWNAPEISVSASPTTISITGQDASSNTRTLCVSIGY